MKKKIITLVFVAVLVGVLGAIVILGKSALNHKTSNTVSKPSIAELSAGEPINDSAPAIQEDVEKTEAVSEEKKIDVVAVNPSTEKKSEQTTSIVETTTNTTSKANANELKIIDRLISWGFQNASNRKISAIILHSSYDAIGNDPYSVDGILKEYKDYGVSAHYLIDRDGKIYRLVKDEDIAYHAGVSSLPNGEKNVNVVSIGVEILNTKDGKFTDAQYDATNALIASIKDDHDIKYVLGHDQIAPGRKTDPWNMDWSRIKK